MKFQNIKQKNFSYRLAGGGCKVKFEVKKMKFFFLLIDVKKLELI